MSADCSACGLSGCSTGEAAQLAADYLGTVALAGNPNVGKSSVFNALTGLRQHTGNWPGKTVLRALGRYIHNNRQIEVVDLPGTYSLSARSAEEEVARDYICFGHPDVTVVVIDATAIERNLNLVLQVAEITSKLIVCVNLLDEARRKRIAVNLESLSTELGVPVVGTVARSRRGIHELKDVIDGVITGTIVPHPKTVRYSDEIESRVAELEPQIRDIVDDFVPSRFVALRIIEGDTAILDKLSAPSFDQSSPLFRPKAVA